MKLNIVVQVDDYGLIHEGANITPESGAVVLDGAQNVRVKVRALPGQRPGQTFLTLVVRIGTKTEYVVPAHIPGQYILTRTHGYRVIPLEEVGDPVERMIRAERMSPDIIHRYRTPIPEFDTPEKGIVTLACKESSLSLKPFNYVTTQTAALVMGDHARVTFGEWKAAGPGLGKLREVHFRMSSDLLLIVVADVRVGQKHPGIIKRLIKALHVGKDVTLEKVEAALTLAKTENLSVIQAQTPTATLVTQR